MVSLIASEFDRLWRMRIVKGMFILFLMVTGFCIYFLTLFDNGQYTVESNTTLNAVNFPWFLLRETSFFISLLLMPFLYVVVLNGEVKSNAYSLIMYRPFSRVQFLYSKWGTLALISFVVTVLLMFIGITSGLLLYPIPEYVEFYNDPLKYSVVSGYLYTFRHFFLFYLILLSGMVLATIVSILSPNQIIAFFILLITFIFPVYFSESFLYLLLPSQSIFTAMSSNEWSQLYTIIPMVLLFGSIIGTIIWKRMDFR